MRRARFAVVSVFSIAAVAAVVVLCLKHRPAAPAPEITGSPAAPGGSVAAVAASRSMPAGGAAEALAAFAARLGPESTPEQTMAALTALAATDAARAIEFAHALGRTEQEKTLWVTELAKQWAARAPQPAWDWLAQLTQPRLRELATGTLPETILGTLAREHPALLVQNIDRLVHTGETPLGVPPVVAVHLGLEALVAGHDLPLARATVEAWTRDPAQPAIGEAAFVTVARGLARDGSAEAAGAWLKTLPPSAERDIALVEFPAQWSEQNPRAALGWVESNLPAELQPRAVQRAFGDWAERSPAEAAEWLGGYLARTTNGPDTDRLITALVNLGPTLQGNPATALQWTALLSDPRQRTRAEENVVLRWARQDRDAATAYLWQNSTLPTDRRQFVAQQILAAATRPAE
jgi:hypothetical protein